MIRFIILAVTVVIVYKYLKKSFFDPASMMPNDKSQPLQTPELQKCDECEKFVNKAQIVEKEGHFFCSQECYTKFLDKHN